MKRWQAILMLVLLGFPILLFVAVGSWALLESGRMMWVWLTLPLCWGIAYLLARRLKMNVVPLPEARLDAPLHWTAQDEKAWSLIQDKAKSIAEIPQERFTQLQFYIDTAQQISLEIARLYHPKATDPIGSLRVPEILAAGQLALKDLESLVEKHVPGSHMLRVDDWKMLGKTPGWYKKASDLYWMTSLIFGPVPAIQRYALSKFILEPVAQTMQTNVLAWFYMSFVHRVGFYCIEMNSGRLRGGSARYQAMVDGMAPPPASVTKIEKEAPNAAPKEREIREVTLCLAGQVKAGKSSLTNVLLRSQAAQTDILPKTRKVTRYVLDLPGVNDRLVILDTAGYGEDGPTESQVEDTKIAFQESDLVLLVMDATSPAREPDAKFLRAIDAWRKSKPHLKTPPALGVLTHIDLLRPVLEWTPPYNWRNPTKPKEHSIQDAVTYNGQMLEEFIAGVIPVCTDHERGRVYGVEEWLLPAIYPLLGEARACSLLRALHADIERGQARRLVHQFWETGKALLKASLLGHQRV